MQKLIDTLKSFGVEIPEDKQADVKRALSEHYKNAGEVTRTLSKVENERDSWKNRAEAAETTLRSFDGVDVEGMKQSISDWKAKAEKAEQDAKEQIYQRDFADALKTELETIKFSSESAKKAIMSEIKEAGLTMKNGKILGLNDLIEQMKQYDAAAFVDETQQSANQNAAKFTSPVHGGGRTGSGLTKDDFKKMNLDDRLKLKQSDPELYAALSK